MSRVTLGRLAGVFGVKGWLRVASYTRPADNILHYARWWIGDDDSGYESHVVDHRVHSNGIVVQLADSSGQPIEDRNVASALVGREVSVSRDQLPALEEGCFYWADLIGLRVIGEADAPLGTVTDVFSNGAQDVLTISDGERTRMIPFVRGPIVTEVSLEARLIRCQWSPEW